MRVLLIAFAVFIAPLTSAAEDVATIRHRVKKGDSLELLAAEYYGSRDRTIVIMAANRLQHNRPLRAKERLRIPMNQKVTSEPGDTVISLAKLHLGDERRAAFLADYNNLPLEGTLPAGLTIEIPLRVPHKAASDERVANIALAYFGSTRNAGLVREYNFLEDNVVPAGATIIVPLTHVRVQSSRLPRQDADSDARLAKRKRMQELSSRLLPGAYAAWRQGEFSRVKGELAKIDTQYLDSIEAAEIAVLLGSAHLAFNDKGLALAEFKKALERAPEHRLSTYQYSPAIRALWKQAGGKTSDD